jgi:sugar lactone lactonase YvrE
MRVDEKILLGSDGYRYEWTEDWADLAGDDLAVAWTHHALGATDDGHVVGFDPVDGQVLVLSPEGRVVRRLECGVVAGHGLCVAEVGGVEHLWIADMGLRAVPAPASPYGYGLHVPEGARGRVLQVRLDDGTVVAELPTPEHRLYANRPCVPTAVAVTPDGDIWVADGYGASLLHRYSSDGRLLASLSGEESPAGRFDCPHALLLDRRRGEPELYVADRENLRLLVFDMAGTFRREVAQGALARPSALATHGDLLIVAELRARLTLLDRDDQVVGHLGDDEAVADRPGWPNAIDDDGRFVRQTTLRPGRFNSPHGLAVDATGALYVAEWLIGGRCTKLSPVERS